MSSLLQRVLFCCCFVFVAAIAAAEPPNIILINIDDLGYGDIGPFGSTGNKTPHLDRMAKEGRLLRSHYAAPVCTPSRASLMTGCYPKRALPINHVLFPCAAIGLAPSEITVAEVLKSVGYSTGCIGKWHLGDQPQFLPTEQGFDYYYGLPYSNDMGTVADGAKSNPGQKPRNLKNRTPRDNIPPDGIRGIDQPPLPLLENNKVIERVAAAEQTTITARYAQKAVDFIDDHADQTFFLYLPHTAVHFPLYPGMEFRGKSGNGLINDWVQEVDWAVGEVLDAVRRNNLQQNTLVIFTSDNGGSLRHGSRNKPLKGGKGTTFEGGVRVPTIFWWPGTVPADSATDAITTTMDLLPTFAHLAGAEVPSDRKIDGMNIWPVVMSATSGPRDTFLYFRSMQLQAVRKGPWKLHLKKTGLFNLASDIGETTNVAADHPNIVAELQALATATEADLGREGPGPQCRKPGMVENPQPLIGYDGTIREEFRP